MESRKSNKNKMPDLRKQFFKTILEIARTDKKVMVLTGDLGFSFVDEFQKELPEQFINCGIAEQNLIGVASGLAMGGFKPYCYSGAIFLLMRAYEQIRDNVCYQNLNVKLIGTGASGFLGFTHNLKGSENEEDLLKNLPNIKRFYPQDEAEADRIIKETYLCGKPAYIRI